MSWTTSEPTGPAWTRWSLGSQTRRESVVRDRRQVSCPGSKDWGVVRGKLGRDKVRRLTEDKSKQVRVPGKPELGQAKGRQGQVVRQEPIGKSCMWRDRQQSGWCYVTAHLGLEYCG